MASFGRDLVSLQTSIVFGNNGESGGFGPFPATVAEQRWFGGDLLGLLYWSNKLDGGEELRWWFGGGTTMRKPKEEER